VLSSSKFIPPVNGDVAVGTFRQGKPIYLPTIVPVSPQATFWQSCLTDLCRLVAVCQQLSIRNIDSQSGRRQSGSSQWQILSHPADLLEALPRSRLPASGQVKQLFTASSTKPPLSGVSHSERKPTQYYPADAPYLRKPPVRSW